MESFDHGGLLKLIFLGDFNGRRRRLVEEEKNKMNDVRILSDSLFQVTFSNGERDDEIRRMV